jgi:hypothetical protein
MTTEEKAQLEAWLVAVGFKMSMEEGEDKPLRHRPTTWVIGEGPFFVPRDGSVRLWVVISSMVALHPGATTGIRRPWTVALHRVGYMNSRPAVDGPLRYDSPEPAQRVLLDWVQGVRNDN